MTNVPATTRNATEDRKALMVLAGERIPARHRPQPRRQG